jgi:hypothetical protein
MRKFITCTLRQKYRYNDAVNEDEVSMACSTYDRGMHKGFGGKRRRKETTGKT